MNRRQMMKQITIASLLMLLVLLLAACGGRTSEAASPDANNDAAQAAAPAAEAEQAAVQGDPAAGEKLYQSTCVACHGADATGVQGLGKSLHPSASEFISSATDDELVDFIKQGRQPGDPGNTTGVAMPPMVVNPELSD